MAIRAKAPDWKTILFVIAAAAVWAANQWKPELLRGWKGAPPHDGTSSAETRGYQKLQGCRWVDHRQNDGDSFRLRLSDGRVEQFRLYYVDAPESEFRSYKGGATNHERIHEQARDMHLADDGEAVAIGKRAKEEVRELLAGHDLTIYTKWQDPFGDHRYRAFVEIPGGGWLHEWLLRNGYARVHTKGAALPDGTPERAHWNKLKQIERDILQRR